MSGDTDKPVWDNGGTNDVQSLFKNSPSASLWYNCMKSVVDPPIYLYDIAGGQQNNMFENGVKVYTIF